MYKQMFISLLFFLASFAFFLAFLEARKLKKQKIQTLLGKNMTEEDIS